LRKTYRYWNLAASIVAVIMLATAAGRLRAYLLPPQAENSTPAVSEPSQPASAESKAASGESKPADAEEPHGGLKTQIYQWINFLILVAGLWYLTAKVLVPFLQGRGEAIREDMRVSSQVLQQASVRLAAVEEKLKRLDEEIASLRSSALGEAAGERGRIEEAANADANKIAVAAEQEIMAAAKLARQELKTYAAELAMSLAEKRIQSSMSPESDRGIFRAFIEGLGDKAPGSQGASKPRNGGA